MNSSPQAAASAGGHDRIAVHQRLERADRVDLDDRHVRAVAGHPRGDPLAHPAVAGDDDLAPGDEDVRRAQDAVERALAGAVAVVEEVLGLGLVDRDDREAEHPVGGHRPQPDDAGRRLLGPGVDLGHLVRALGVEQVHEVAAVVHRQLRMRVGDRPQVRVVGLVVLAAPGERRDAVLGDERGRHVVLGRERVARREHDLRAAGLERAHQVGRLGRDVEARADAQAVERPVALEALADEAQDGHLALGPLDPSDALGGEAEVGHVVGRGCAGGRHRGSVSLRLKRRRNGAARSGQGEPRRWTRRSSKRTCSCVSEAAIGVERGRVVGADVEHDLVARPQQLGGHRAGDGGREAATTIVDMGQDVADDRQARPRADHVRARGGDQLAVDAQAVVDAVGDRRRRQPRREAELVEPVEVADLDRQEPLDARRVRPELRRSTHIRTIDGPGSTR